MLNISTNSVAGEISAQDYTSFGMLKGFRAGKILARLILMFIALVIAFSFIPWTQNIRSKGYVTTLQPEQRPQTIHAIIDGQIEKWFVREGNFVNQGDTILYIAEIKDDYFDPQLLDRTKQQISAKKGAVKFYREKVDALDNQIQALQQTLKLKLQQTQNYIRQAQLKVQSDSMELEAAIINYSIAQRQFSGTEQLYKDGLKSLTEFETKKSKLQETQAKQIQAENKLLASKNDLINARVELLSVETQYRDKLAKARSDRAEAISALYDGQGSVAKMENQYANYEIRTRQYYITAPQTGYVTKAIREGIGETVKAGEAIVSIMPADYQLAVEMYVNPVDLPLIHRGQHVRFMFDGWPAIVFSGWPNVSYGTFGGEVVAIDNFVSDNGKYRLLVGPDPDSPDWPDALRVGSGAVGLALLEDVPIWYEVWRQLNGFPPNYYEQEDKESDKDEVKKKPPLKSVK